MNDPAAAAAPLATDRARDFLGALGERIRLARARRGMSRKMLADAAGVSLRYLSDLENGTGNASILLLREVAQALAVPVEEIVSESRERSGEFIMLVEALRALPEERLAAARRALDAFLAPGAGGHERQGRIALIGLRGAGKSTIGKLLAANLGIPFVELNREIERAAGMPAGEVHALYGQSGYRRLERQCLDAVLDEHARVVLSTPGSLVSNPQTYHTLLAHFYTVWLRATPEEHMARVVAQGDLRPIAGHDEAMADLMRILEGRTPFYAQADCAFDTSGLTPAAAAAGLQALLPVSSD